MKKLILLFLIFTVANVSYSQEIRIAKTLDSTHNTVVALMRLDSTEKIITRATGVLINPRVILTAGHVHYKRYPDGIDRRGFISPSNKALQSNNYISFDWIDNVETHPDQMAYSKSVADTTGASNPDNFLDIGLIFLDTPVKNMPVAKLPASSLFK
jgi:V8-like Glu-specific endopeptidase